MTNFPNSQSVVTFFNNGKIFSNTIKNESGSISSYNSQDDSWFDLSDCEVAYYNKVSSKILNEDDGHGMIVNEFPKSQFVLVFFHNGKPFAETIDNTTGHPVVYNAYNDAWVEISEGELAYYKAKASKIITSED